MGAKELQEAGYIYAFTANHWLFGSHGGNDQELEKNASRTACFSPRLSTLTPPRFLLVLLCQGIISS
jgi:hypothetical protein